MNTINNIYNQQILSLTQKSPKKHLDQPIKGFQDILQLQSQSNNNHLEDYNYAVNELGKKVEGDRKVNSENFFLFPPESAPVGVKEAYEKLSGMEKRMIEASILTMVRSSIGHPFDKNKKNFKPQHVDFNNDLNLFFNKEDFSYVKMTNEMIQNWEENKFLNTPESYLRRKQVLEKFKGGLIENGVK